MNTKTAPWDHEWSPWTLRNGSIVESVGWTGIKMLNQSSATNEAKLNRQRLEAGAPPGEWPYIHRRPTVFPSLCDWLDDEVPVEWLARFLELIYSTPSLMWLLRTKRPENWVKRVIAASLRLRRTNESAACYWREWAHCDGMCPGNVWVGTSVEDQIRADQRIPALLKIPAVGRFLSCEPLLGPVDLRHMDADAAGHADLCKVNALTGRHTDMGRPCRDVAKVDWAIIGGDAGHEARPCNIEWIRSIVSQCKETSVPAFVKRLGARPFEEEFAHTKECWNEQCALAGGPEDCAGSVERENWTLTHPAGGDPAEWPDDLRVREFPEDLR